MSWPWQYFKSKVTNKCFNSYLEITFGGLWWPLPCFEIKVKVAGQGQMPGAKLELEQCLKMNIRSENLKDYVFPLDIPSQNTCSKYRMVLWGCVMITCYKMEICILLCKQCGYSSSQRRYVRTPLINAQFQSMLIITDKNPGSDPSSQDPRALHKVLLKASANKNAIGEFVSWMTPCLRDRVQSSMSKKKGNRWPFFTDPPPP